MPTLFSKARLGRLSLRNRIVMAPMTRSRAGVRDEATDAMVEYYRQRASAGLIISEGIYPSPNGKGYCRTPGLVTDVQVDRWRKVVNAVHASDGTVVAQLMHCGRIAHADNKAPGSESVSPSAIPAKGEMYTDRAGMQPFSPPRALDRHEIPDLIQEFRGATELAYEAGFDGVELHCTSGYLPAQFLSTGTNRRDDDYGPSLAGRVRFPIEVLRAMSDVDGADRVGFRICPGNPFNDLFDDDPRETFTTFLHGVREFGLAYCHVIRLHDVELDNIELARDAFGEALIVNDSYDFAEASHAVENSRAAAVSFARLFLANPDLVRRFELGETLNRIDPKTLYTPGPAGYTDYPTLDDAAG